MSLSLFIGSFTVLIVNSRNTMDYCMGANEPGQNRWGEVPMDYYNHILNGNVIIPAGTYSINYCNWDIGTVEKLEGYIWAYSWMYTCCDGNICVDVYEDTANCDSNAAETVTHYEFSSDEREYNCNGEDCSLTFDWYANTGGNSSCDLSYNYASVSLVNGGCVYDWSVGGYYLGVKCDPDSSEYFEYGYFADENCMDYGDGYDYFWADTCASPSGNGYGETGILNINCNGMLPSTTMYPETTKVIDPDSCSFIHFQSFLPIPMAEEDSSDYCLKTNDTESWNFYCDSDYLPVGRVYDNDNCDNSGNYFELDRTLLSDYTNTWYYSCGGSGDNCDSQTVNRNLYNPNDGETIEDCIDGLMSDNPDQSYPLVWDTCIYGTMWSCNDEYEYGDIEDGIANWEYIAYQYPNCTGYSMSGFGGDTDTDTDTDEDNDCVAAYPGCMSTSTSTSSTTSSGTNTTDGGGAGNESSKIIIKYAIAFVMVFSVILV